jgi:hypothetical protein
MKTIFFVLLLYLSVSANTFAQKVRFSNFNNIWGIQVAAPGSAANGMIFPYNYTASVQKNGHIYNVLEGYFWQDSILVREDSLLQKVYCIPYKVKGHYIADTVERILYDFSLQVGDTFSSTITFVGSSQQFAYACMVSSIDTFFINGTPHREWSMQPVQGGGGYHVLEGIGTRNDPVTPLYPWMPPISEMWWDLVCFSNDTSYPYIVGYPNTSPPFNNTACSLSYCPAPVISIAYADDTSVLLTWPPDASNQYMYSFSQGSTSTNVISTTDTFVLITGLTPGTSYFFSLRRLCSDWGNKIVTTTITDIEALHGKTISIAPNPVRNFLTINGLPEKRKGDIAIYGVTGMKAMSLPINHEKETVDVSRLSAGMYFLRYSSEEKTCTVKFLKE